MIKYFCDGCKKEIVGDVIYRIRIYDAPKTGYYLNTTNEASGYNANSCYVEWPMYCKKCKEKVESLINYSL